MKKERESYPISKYVGKFPKGKWIFVEEFKGTEEEALKRAGELYKKDKNKKAQYRLWDQRG